MQRHQVGVMGKLLNFFRGSETPRLPDIPAPPPVAAAAAAETRSSAPAPQAVSPVRRVVDDRARALDLTSHPLVPEVYDGEEVVARGYVFGGHKPGWTPKTAVLLEVRGVTFGDRLEVLQAPCLAPLSEVRLRREPENPRDDRAIAVDTIDGRHVGYLPAEFSAGVAPLFDRGYKAAAIVAVEWRRKDGGQRCGLRLLLAAGVERIDYRVVTPDVYD